MEDQRLCRSIASRPNSIVLIGELQQQITLRIDADILAWLRAQAPEGYQSRLNAVLRKAMLQELLEQSGSAAKPA